MEEHGAAVEEGLLEKLPKEGSQSEGICDSETPATKLLRSLSVAFSEHHFQYIEKGGTNASSSSLGVPEHSVIKTLGTHSLFVSRTPFQEIFSSVASPILKLIEIPNQFLRTTQKSL